MPPEMTLDSVRFFQFAAPIEDARSRTLQVIELVVLQGPDECHEPYSSHPDGKWNQKYRIHLARPDP